MKFRAQRAQIALLLTPGLAIFALFTVYPIIRLFWMSLCDMSFASMLEQPFAGLANYREVFRDPTFWTVFVNSLVYTAITVPGQMALGLFIAILLSGIKRFSVTFRVINYLPVVTSWVIASLVLRYIFNTEGLLNYFLWKVLGVTSGNIRWLDTKSTVPRMPGSVTFRNFFHAPQPSISAASYRSCGTCCSAARKMTMFQPMPFQMPRIIATARPLHLVSSQRMLPEVTPSTFHRK